MCRKQKPWQSLTPIQSGEIGLSTGSGENWRPTLDFILRPKAAASQGRSTIVQRLRTISVHGHYHTNSSRNLHAGARVAILSGILFLSGIGALIFETLWLRLSGLAFGNSVWAAALILSSFMAGLALGNGIAASSRIRRWRPLHLYAVLELLVALFGCTIVFGLPLLGELIRPAWQTLWNYQPALLGLRFIISFLILLVPTMAMGLTLPVLIEDPVLRQTNFGRAIGFLYGSNTLGAVVGVVRG